jgi:hypothetical protein
MSDPDPDQYDRRTVLKLSGTAAAAAVTGGVAVSPAAAQEQPEGLFDDQTVSGRVRKWGAFVGGFLSGVGSRVNVFEETDASQIDTHVSAIVDEFNAHRSDWITYVNDRDLGGDSRETLAITFQYAGETRERYVVADYADGAYQSVEVQTPEEWSQDSADIEATVSDDAVENGADELRTLHDEYIVPNKDIERSYASELAGRYYFAPNDHVSVPESLLG